MDDLSKTLSTAAGVPVAVVKLIGNRIMWVAVLGGGVVTRGISLIPRCAEATAELVSKIMWSKEDCDD